MKRLLILLVILGVVLVFSPAAYSFGHLTESATGYFMVQGRVVPYCTVSASDFVFPDIEENEAIARGNWGNSEVVVNCTKDTDFRIFLSKGENWQGDFRHMESTAPGGGKYIKYRLWFESSLNSFTRWEDIHAFAPPLVTSTGAEYRREIYGNVPAQSADGGFYEDRVEITLKYGPD
jgi:spore coat protein U-like protein